MEKLDAETLAIVAMVKFLVLLVVLMLVGFALGGGRGRLFQHCDHCDAPMPDGFWNHTDEHGYLCETCGKKLNVRAWYAKEVEPGKWIG